MDTYFFNFSFKVSFYDSIIYEIEASSLFNPPLGPEHLDYFQFFVFILGWDKHLCLLRFQLIFHCPHPISRIFNLKFLIGEMNRSKNRSTFWGVIFLILPCNEPGLDSFWFSWVMKQSRVCLIYPSFSSTFPCVGSLVGFPYCEMYRTRKFLKEQGWEWRQLGDLRSGTSEKMDLTSQLEGGSVLKGSRQHFI